MRSLEEILAHREVLWALVLRDLKARYRGSVLGFLWTLLHPLLLMGIYSLVFSVYMRVDIPMYPIFVFAGLLPWIWFSSAILTGTSSIIDGGSLVKRMPFPPQVLPVASVTATLVNFLLALPVLFVFALVTGLGLTWTLVVLPVIIVIQYVFTLGLAILLSMVMVRFRDIHHVVANLLTLWFFLTPVLYPAAFVPEPFRSLLWLNPLAPLMVAFQDAVYRGRLPAPHDLAVAAALALVVLAAALALCDRLRWVLVEQV